jgi:hypothetical protein
MDSPLAAIVLAARRGQSRVVSGEEKRAEPGSDKK